ncbi:MAG: alkaline phosphatase family protein [Anaerolineae bacterium]
MATHKRLAVIGFDSISLPFLETFVRRGVMPTVERLMAQGSTTQTWPCYPMETATNWACLATGATPAIHGCNMAMPEPSGPLSRVIQAFPADYCRAEQLWSAAHRAGRRSIVFDWTQSYPLAFEDDLIHVGEDGRPRLARRALQEVRAYTTNPDIPESFHVTRVAPLPAQEWANLPEGPDDGDLEFRVPIEPTAGRPGWSEMLPCRHRRASSLVARIERGSDGYNAVSLYASKMVPHPLLTVTPGTWSNWVRHTFTVDGEPVDAHVRAKLLALSPDGKEVHLYLSQIYPAEGFIHPKSLAPELIDVCAPYVNQASRQQVVIANASDIATYFEEQHDMGNWYRKAAQHLLTTQDWDLFMFKWHGPDWTNHLTMYMIDPDHPMYDPDRAEEGWAYWDRLMALGDTIVKTVIDAAGDDTVVALVSDHGGSTDYTGVHADPIRTALKELGLLAETPDGAIDWSRTKAWSLKHYVYVNTSDRPNGTVQPNSDEHEAIKAQIIEALLDLKDHRGRHAFRAVLPIELAAYLGVAGPFAGDVFVIPSPEPKPTREEFLALHPDPKARGTWDWPRLNSGAHSDDSYLAMCGPGIRQRYRRPKPTMITSVAPTVAAAVGLPVPKDANGAVLQDFLT